MIAPLATFIDWLALHMAYAVAGLKYVPRPQWKFERSAGISKWAGLQPDIWRLPQGHIAGIIANCT
jgi:hypothetical protein